MQKAHSRVTKPVSLSIFYGCAATVGDVTLLGNVMKFTSLITLLMYF